MKVILITGASSGFGKLTAEKLLKKGYTVYAAARRIEKMKDLEQQGAKLLKMDVTSDSDVEEGVNKIIADEGQIDALLANAGYGSYSMVESISLEELKYQYEVNVFGNARLLKHILPYMRAQKQGRIVLTSSMVSNISTVGAGWYASTKHAIRAMGTALRQEVKGFGIDVVMIEPGVVKTEFDSVALDTLKKINHPEDYSRQVTAFHNWIEDLYSKSPGPEGTANCMFKALTAKRPKFIYRTTSDSKLFPMVQTLISGRSYDKLILSLIKKAGKKAA